MNTLCCRDTELVRFGLGHDLVRQWSNMAGIKEMVEPVLMKKTEWKAPSGPSSSDLAGQLSKIQGILYLNKPVLWKRRNQSAGAQTGLSPARFTHVFNSDRTF